MPRQGGEVILRPTRLNRPHEGARRRGGGRKVDPLPLDAAQSDLEILEHVLDRKSRGKIARQHQWDFCRDHAGVGGVVLERLLQPRQRNTAPVKQGQGLRQTRDLGGADHVGGHLHVGGGADRPHVEDGPGRGLEHRGGAFQHRFLTADIIDKLTFRRDVAGSREGRIQEGGPPFTDETRSLEDLGGADGGVVDHDMGIAQGRPHRADHLKERLAVAYKDLDDVGRFRDLAGRGEEIRFGSRRAVPDKDGKSAAS